MSKKLSFKIQDKFNKLIIIKDLGIQNRKRYVLCQCDCGSKPKSIRVDLLISGRVKSCGCFQKAQVKRANITHNKSYSKEYRVWIEIIARCCNPSHPQYENYGGRNIKMCNRWQKSFNNFYKDMGNAPSPKYEIDRINNNQSYNKKNCRWVLHQTNMQNTRASKYWYINGKKYNSRQEAALKEEVSQTTITAWCYGQTFKGKYYPPKQNCYTEYKYPRN